MQVALYTETQAGAWDELVARAPMATFLHTRRFLAYHRERFEDLSLFITSDERSVLGVFPAALDPSDRRRVVSHPGITFGAVLHDGSLAGERMIEALECIARDYAGRGLETLRYKAIPHIYHRRPASDDLYALFRLRATRSRCDLSCAVDLLARPEPSSIRKRSLKKAEQAGVEVVDGAPVIDELWEVLEENLDRKLGEKPTHTLDEIKEIHARFPDSVSFLVARHQGRTVAGIALFSSAAVARAQYIASSPAGYGVCALDAVIERAIGEVRERGRRYFDFGTSNTHGGRQLSQSLYQFKRQFGGGGVVHEYYDLELDETRRAEKA